MSTDLSPSQLMMLTQWLSPAFPVGAFSYSHGLEFVLNETPDLDVATWLDDVLRHGAGRTDAILMRTAFGGAEDEADALARALAPSKERLLETNQQGAAFCATLRAAFDMDLPDLAYPVALGVAARLKNLPVEPVVTLYLHAFTSNLVAAAQRLSPLGQSQAQAMIDRLGAVCEAVAADTQDSTLDDLGAAAWAADVASMRHETMTTRIFRT